MCKGHDSMPTAATPCPRRTTRGAMRGARSPPRQILHVGVWIIGLVILDMRIVVRLDDCHPLQVLLAMWRLRLLQGEPMEWRDPWPPFPSRHLWPERLGNGYLHAMLEHPFLSRVCIRGFTCLVAHFFHQGVRQAILKQVFLLLANVPRPGASANRRWA